MESILLRLFEINAIKFGQFKLKSGLTSPIYFDLRVIIGYPDLMKLISEAMYDVMSKEVNQLCGVPYTALPLACCISIKHGIPTVIKRKEAKDYGTKKLIEGVFEPGMTCCVIEDVITTGSSVIDTAKELSNVGLKVTEAIILVDRGQGGRQNIENMGISVKSLLKLDEILTTLLRLNCITESKYQECIQFLSGVQVAIPAPIKLSKIAISDRITASQNKVTRRLFETIAKKKSSLCVAADVRSMDLLLRLAEEVAPFISVLKVHADIIDDFNHAQMRLLKQMSLEKNFLLMADRKLADIGSTVRSQLLAAAIDYLSWADLVTVHILPGDGVLDGVQSAASERGVDIGCLLLAEMSSGGTSLEYRSECARMAQRHASIVAGFVLQNPLPIDVGAGFVYCTPGVLMTPGGDTLGQRYRSVEELKGAGFVDLFIVGRAVAGAAVPAEEAARYREATVRDHY